VALDEYQGVDDLHALWTQLNLPDDDMGVMWANLADMFHEFPAYKHSYRTLYSVWSSMGVELTWTDELYSLLDNYDWNTKNPFVRNVIAEIAEEEAPDAEYDFNLKIKTAAWDSKAFGIGTNLKGNAERRDQENEVTNLFMLMQAYHQPVFGKSLSTFEHELTKLGYRPDDIQKLTTAYDDILKHKHTAPGQQFMFGEKVYRIQDCTQWIKE
jgi:hypothetical protein